MKKNYQTPTLKIVKLRNSSIFAASPPSPSTDEPATEPAGARSFRDFEPDE